MKDRTLKDEGNPRGVDGICEVQENENLEHSERCNDSPIVESYNNGLVPQDTDQTVDQSREATEGSDGKKYVWVGE